MTLAKTQEIALGMEAAAKEASELQVSSQGLEINKVTKDSSNKCFRCAKKGHTPDNCYFRMQKCKNCGKQRHTYKVCRAPSGGTTCTATKAPEKTPPRRQQNYLEESEDQTFGLFTVRDKGDLSILIDLSINGTPNTMTLDTGASISIISEKTYQTQLPRLQLHKSQCY